MLYEIKKNFYEEIVVVEHKDIEEKKSTYIIGGYTRISKVHMDKITEHQCCFRDERKIFTTNKDKVEQYKLEIINYYKDFYLKVINGYKEKLKKLGVDNNV